MDYDKISNSIRAYVFEMDMNSSNFEERCLYQSGKIGGNKCKEPWMGIKRYPFDGEIIM